MSACDVAKEFGVDMSLVDESLALMPEQRAIQHQNALDWLCRRRSPSMRVTEINMAELIRHAMSDVRLFRLAHT